MAAYPPPPADGLSLRWSAWDGDAIEETSIRWENEGWTVDSRLHGADVQYVLRLSAQWRVQQFMLFRDLDEPDLWLATDGSGRWGEVNGAHRVDLDGCMAIDITTTAVTESLAVRGLPLAVGHGAELVVAVIDVETLGVVPRSRRLSRLDDRRWLIEEPDDGSAAEVDVDEFGFVLDHPDRVRRLG